MSYVFNLLSVSWGFFQSFDDQGSSRRYNIDLCLTILNSQLNCDLQTFPIGSCFCNIATNDSQIHNSDCSGIEFGTHLEFCLCAGSLN